MALEAVSVEEVPRCLLVMDRSDYLPIERLQELVAQVDPLLQLEPQAEQVLQDVADDFVENVAAFACELCRHREGKVLEAKDLQLALEKNWNMRLPGVGDTAAELKALKKAPQTQTDIHRQRLQLVRKSQAQQARLSSAEAAEKHQTVRGSG